MDKLAVAAAGIKVLPGLIRASGSYRPPMATQPGTWELEEDGWHLLLTENFLVLPIDPELSSLIDIWAPQGGKVFSVAWMPARPWQPPLITHCKAGDWMQVFGVVPGRAPTGGA